MATAVVMVMNVVMDVMTVVRMTSRTNVAGGQGSMRCLT